MRRITSTLKFYLITLFSVFLISSTYAQPPNPNDRFRNLPVVTYYEDNTRHESILERYGIDTIVEKRTKALSFFNLMRTISEPSTISAISNVTKNFDGYQKKPFILDADIQNPIAVGGKKWYTGNIMHTVHLIPQFQVRIFRDDPDAPGDPYGNVQGDTSLPVRTPSTKPRITWYWANMDKWARKDTTAHGKQCSSSRFWGFSAFHFSNGQDGPEFYPDSSINVYNGNFGEQLAFEVMVGSIKDFQSKRYHDQRGRDKALKEKQREKDFSRTVKVDTVLASDYPYNRRSYWKASLELHWPNALTSKAFDEYDLYGRYRFNFQYGHSWIPSYRDLILSKDKKSFVQTTPYQAKELFRFVGNFQYILDPSYNDGDMKVQSSVPIFDIRRMNLYGTLYWRMTGAPNAALFLQAGYWGSDNYNIYFQEQLLNFRFGIALAFFKYPKFGDFKRDPKRS